MRLTHSLLSLDSYVSWFFHFDVPDISYGKVLDSVASLSL